MGVPEDVDVTSAGLKKPGEPAPSDTVKSLRPPVSLTNMNRSVSPLTAPVGAPVKKRSPLALIIIMGIIFSAVIYFYLNKQAVDSTEKDPEKTALEENENKRPGDSAPIEQIPEGSGTLTSEKPELILPEIPAARGSWMFMPWDTYEPEEFCNDGRFDYIEGDYTVEFWFKKNIDIPGEVNLFEFLNEGSPVERIFLNTENEICFTAANGQPVVSYRKKVPPTNRH